MRHLNETRHITLPQYLFDTGNLFNCSVRSYLQSSVQTSRYGDALARLSWTAERFFQLFDSAFGLLQFLDERIDGLFGPFLLFVALLPAQQFLNGRAGKREQAVYRRNRRRRTARIELVHLHCTGAWNAINHAHARKVYSMSPVSPDNGECWLIIILFIYCYYCCFGGREKGKRASLIRIQRRTVAVVRTDTFRSEPRQRCNGVLLTHLLRSPYGCVCCAVAGFCVSAGVPRRRRFRGRAYRGSSDFKPRPRLVTTGSFYRPLRARRRAGARYGFRSQRCRYDDTAACVSGPGQCSRSSSTAAVVYGCVRSTISCERMVRDKRIGIRYIIIMLRTSTRRVAGDKLSSSLQSR